MPSSPTRGVKLRLTGFFLIPPSNGAGGPDAGPTGAAYMGEWFAGLSYAFLGMREPGQRNGPGGYCSTTWTSWFPNPSTP